MARVYHPSIKLVKRIVGNSDLPWSMGRIVAPSVNGLGILAMGRRSTYYL